MYEDEPIGVFERLDMAIDSYFRPAPGYWCIRCSDTGHDPARPGRACSCETGCYLNGLQAGQTRTTTPRC